jgi:hypothetical protein
VTTSHDLVITGGGGAGPGAWTGRDEVAPRSVSAPEVSKHRPDTDNMGFGGNTRDITTHPLCRPYRPPSKAIGSLSTLLVRPSVLHGHPLPRCSAGLAALPPLGDRSAGGRATRGPGSQPPPPPPLGLSRTRPPSSVLAVPGRGQTGLRASKGRRRRAGPFRSGPPLCPRVGETRPARAQLLSPPSWTPPLPAGAPTARCQTPPRARA